MTQKFQTYRDRKPNGFLPNDKPNHRKLTRPCPVAIGFDTGDDGNTWTPPPPPAAQRRIATTTVDDDGGLIGLDMAAAAMIGHRPTIDPSSPSTAATAWLGLQGSRGLAMVKPSPSPHRCHHTPLPKPIAFTTSWVVAGGDFSNKLLPPIVRHQIRSATAATACVACGIDPPKHIVTIALATAATSSGGRR